ncbi:MAG: hypothetical protein ACM3YE_09080 [Bacteroidota bacterium]
MRKIPPGMILGDPIKMNIIYNEFLSVCKLFIYCYFEMERNEKFNSIQKENFYRNVFIDKYVRKFKYDFNLGYLLFTLESGVVSEDFTTEYRIDIQIQSTKSIQYCDEQFYLAFECKRLKNCGNNKEYINGGMSRFVLDEKYSKGYPFAGMIGFIVKGSVSKIIQDLKTRIENHPEESLRSSFAEFKLTDSFNYSFQTKHKALYETIVDKFITV